MQSQGFPACCTSTILTGMGSTENQDWSARGSNGMNTSWFVDKLHFYMANEARMGRAMLQAVITDQQQNCLKAMRILGWRFGPWAKSRNHHNTNPRLCYWLVTDGVPDLNEARKKVQQVTLRNKL